MGVVNPMRKSVRLQDLRAHACRWPIGEPWERAKFFCGEPTVIGRSWCERHLRMVFAPPSSIERNDFVKFNFRI
jgi:GcrA cell cycle regulator